MGQVYETVNTGPYAYGIGSWAMWYQFIAAHGERVGVEKDDEGRFLTDHFFSKIHPTLEVVDDDGEPVTKGLIFVNKPFYVREK